MKINKLQKNKGFTLVELLVATLIFTMVAVVSMGALLTTFDSAKNARALRFAMDNVNFAVESMTRSIRMGTNYVCARAGEPIDMTGDPDKTADCENGGTFIAFIPQKAEEKGLRVGYKQTTRETDGTRTLQRCSGSSECVDIVAPDVNIDELNFIVKGSSPTDQIQASVYIIIKGNVMVKGEPTSFSIQTMASQRNF
jgi:prepilin-type N-terminal cleavage/methylation domain-containing protein